MGQALSAVYLIGIAIFMAIACVVGARKDAPPDSRRSPKNSRRPRRDEVRPEVRPDKNRQAIGARMGSLVFAAVVLLLLGLCLQIFRPS
jgi:hypothetical protein